MRVSGTARSNRITTTLLVLAALVSFAALWPDARQRASALYVFVLALGWAHLIGAAWVGRRAGRPRPWQASRRLWMGIGFVSVVAAFAACFAVLDWLAVDDFLIATSPLLALSVWHTVENDIAVTGAYGRGLALGRIPRDTYFPTIVGMALVMAAVVVLLELGVTFADVFAASTLYHIFQWLVFLRDRMAASRDPAAGAAIRRAIVWSHVPVALACAGVVVWRSSLPPLAFEIVFSPALYLVGSALHVIQTALARAREGLRRPLPAVA